MKQTLKKMRIYLSWLSSGICGCWYFRYIKDRQAITTCLYHTIRIMWVWVKIVVRAEQIDNLNMNQRIRWGRLK